MSFDPHDPNNPTNPRDPNETAQHDANGDPRVRDSRTNPPSSDLKALEARVAEIERRIGKAAK